MTEPEVPPSHGGPAAPTIRRLVGVYDADHTLSGELRYWVGTRLGRAHCSLCDVTHGLVRAKRDWQEYRAGLPVPFATFHRDDQPDAIRALHTVPVVVADTDAGIRVLLDGDALARCGGSVDTLADAVASAVAAAGLRWPE